MSLFRYRVYNDLSSPGRYLINYVYLSIFRYRVYNDLSSPGRYLEMNTTASHEELRRLLKDTASCTQLIETLQSHYMLQMLALLIFVFRILKHMDFQPRLGIITRTIRVAAVDL